MKICAYEVETCADDVFIRANVVVTWMDEVLTCAYCITSLNSNY